MSRGTQVEVSGPWMHGAAGILGGAVSTALFYPLDVIRARLQAQDGTASRRLSKMRDHVRHDGVGSMYRGVSSAVAAHSIGWGLYLFIFRQARAIYGDEGHRASTDFAAAMTASLTTATITNPLFVLKTRRQLQEGRGHKSVTTIAGILRHDGVRGLFYGLAPQLLMSSHTAIQLTLYEGIKRHWVPADADRLSALDIAVCSAVSKSLASVATNPIDVVRTRLQDHRNQHADVEIKYRTIPQAFRVILEREGVRGLYHGMGINIVRVVPSTVIGFLAYEYCLTLQRSVCNHLAACS
eukprot:PhM_4_TR19021/c0_g1_i1/m.8892/K15115/SLC25A32, MFT; solute carrier family 25 (mitochondrial folate transporter), member 32